MSYMAVSWFFSELLLSYMETNNFSAILFLLKAFPMVNQRYCNQY